jgi:hypothetical protein
VRILFETSLIRTNRLNLLRKLGLALLKLPEIQKVFFSKGLKQKREPTK